MAGTVSPEDAVRVLMAARDDHTDWHVCTNLDGRGSTDFCADAEDEGMRPCPLYDALGMALVALVDAA